MQPSHPHPADDIHSILNRFQNWAGKHPGVADEHYDVPTGVREIPMEEALRQLRTRRPGQTGTLHETAHLPGLHIPTATPQPATQSGLKSTAKAAPRPRERALKPDRNASKARKQARTSAGITEPRTESRPTSLRPAASPRTNPPPAAQVKRDSSSRKSPDSNFREVLALSVRQKERGKAKPQERPLRVSVRLSKAEERQLQQLVAGSGLTVSEYIRKSALPAEINPSALAPARHSSEDWPAAAAVTPGPAPARSASLLGGWLSLLKNRFRSPATRYTEQA